MNRYIPPCAQCQVIISNCFRIFQKTNPERSHASPWSVSAVPTSLFPVAVVRFHGRKMLVRKAHQGKPCFCASVAAPFSLVCANPFCQTIRFPVNAFQDSLRNLIRLQRLNTKAQPVYLANAPHLQTVSHVPGSAFHPSAGGSGYGNSLLSAHFRKRPVDHPPGSEMIQKAHHLPCGMVHINRAFQDQQIRFQDRLHQRLKFFVMRAVCKIGLEAGIATKTGHTKISGQKKLPELPANLIGKLPGHHTGTSLMALPMNNRNFHNNILPPFFLLFFIFPPCFPLQLFAVGQQLAFGCMMVFTARLTVTISGAIHLRAWTGFPLRCLLFHIRFPFRVPPLSYKYCAPFYAFPIVIKFREMCQKYRCKAEKSIFPTDSLAFLCQYAIVCTGLVPKAPKAAFLAASGTCYLRKKDCGVALITLQSL